MLWKHESIGECGTTRVSTAFLSSPKLPLVFLFNKLTSVFHVSVLLLIMNLVITLLNNCRSTKR